jgi:phospholipid transport system substrate-binding protein
MMQVLGKCAGVAIACVLAASAGTALGADAADESPDTMIKNASTDVLDSIRADSAIKSGDFSHVQKLIDEKIMPHMDFDRITRHAVGRAWRTATPEQQAKLTEQFRILLMRTYAGALSRVTDHKVQMVPTRGQDPGSNDALVRTLVVPSSGDAISIDYRLAKSDAGWKIYDLGIMGVWLGENYRTEFTSSIAQGGVDGLIKQLTDKNSKLSASGGKQS